jgi:hypothetical protein
MSAPAFGSYDLVAVVNHVDRLFRSNSSEVEIEMTISTPNWQSMRPLFQYVPLSDWERFYLIITRDAPLDTG